MSLRTPADIASEGHRPDDLALVQRARLGDHAAFHELVDRHANSLLGLAAALVGNAADAEDTVQETYLGAFRGLGAFKGLSSVKTWLTQILIRQAASHLRGKRRLFGLIRKRSAEARESVPSAAQAAGTRMDVTAAILALSPEHREVLVLRELQAMPYEQIAELLAVPRGTVESRLFRARRAMQQLLGEYLA